MRTVIFVWEAPTTRNGGTPITPDVVASYDLEVSNLDGSNASITSVPTPSASASMSDGSYKARVRAVDDDGQLGLWSLFTEFTVSAIVVPPLSPPSNLVVTLS